MVITMKEIGATSEVRSQVFLTRYVSNTGGALSRMGVGREMYRPEKKRGSDT